jgi:hypothetical protein
MRNGFRAGLERARQAKKPPPRPEPKPAKPAEAATTAKPVEKPEAPPDSVIRHVCGHHSGVRYLSGYVCPACLGKARRERNLRKNARRGERDGTNGGRLPGGSAYLVSYDSATQTWGGTLEIPAADGAPARCFTDSASGVMKLLRQLDGKFREAQGTT